MQRYRDMDGDSPITAYESGPDFIRVEFRGKSIYLYNYDVPGAHDVEQMKRLAAAGEGLAAYISIHIKERYARRER